MSTSCSAILRSSQSYRRTWKLSSALHWRTDMVKGHPHAPCSDGAHHRHQHAPAAGSSSPQQNSSGSMVRRVSQRRLHVLQEDEEVVLAEWGRREASRCDDGGAERRCKLSIRTVAALAAAQPSCTQQNRAQGRGHSQQRTPDSLQIPTSSCVSWRRSSACRQWSAERWTRPGAEGAGCLACCCSRACRPSCWCGP